MSRLYLDPLNQTVSHSVQPDRPGPSGQSSFGPTSLEPFSFQTSDFLTQNRTIEGRALKARIWIVQFSVIKFLEWLPKWPLSKMTVISPFLSNGLFRKNITKLTVVWNKNDCSTIKITSCSFPKWPLYLQNGN